MPKSIVFDNKEIVGIANQTKKSLFLTWVINNICTNHCSYCPSDLHKGTNHHYDWDKARAFIDDCFELYGSLQCNLAGGEPTLSPFFKDLVMQIYQNGGTVNLTSNMVRSLEWWLDVAPYLCALAASYHAEFMTPEKDREFIEKISALSKVTEINARIMMHPERWQQCIDVYDKIVKECEFCTVEMVRIQPTFGTDTIIREINYTDEQLAILNSSKPLVRSYPKKPLSYRTFVIGSNLIYSDFSQEKFVFSVAARLVNNMQTNFEGWKCSIGLESLFVHYDGSVYRGNCGVGGKIGNINTQVIWPDQPIVCNKSFCHCIADVLISKTML